MDKLLLDSGIKSYVSEDERLLWRGKPATNMKFLPAEKFNIFFGVILIIFACAWMILSFNLIGETDNVFSIAKIFPAFGVPFLIIGAYFSIVSPINVIITRKGIEYALTDKRVLMLYDGKKQTLCSYNFTDIKNLNFGCNDDGIGYVTFLGINTQKKSKRPKICGFYNVTDVKMLYKIFSTKIGE